MLKSCVTALLLASLLSGVAHAAGGGGGSSSGGSSGGGSSSGSSSGVSLENLFGSGASSDAESTNTPDSTATLPPATEQATEPATKKKWAKNKWKEKWGDLGPKYTAAVDLVEAKKYEEAIKALKALKKSKDPRVLNYLAFSWRKLGKVDKALPLYFLALNIAPEYTPAHEYLGEAYVQIKDFEKAKAELRVIQKLCGDQDCEEFKDLAAYIQKGEAVQKAEGNPG